MTAVDAGGVAVQCRWHGRHWRGTGNGDLEVELLEDVHDRIRLGEMVENVGVSHGATRHRRRSSGMCLPCPFDPLLLTSVSESSVSRDSFFCWSGLRCRLVSVGRLRSKQGLSLVLACSGTIPGSIASPGSRNEVSDGVVECPENEDEQEQAD
jgi:hypothetical protein